MTRKTTHCIGRCGKKLFSLVLCVVMVLSAVPCAHAQSDSEIRAGAARMYQSATQMHINGHPGDTNFENECTALTYYSLLTLNIHNYNYGSYGNGNTWYPNFPAGKTNLGNYTAIKKSGANAIKEFVNEYGNEIYNLMVGFSWGYGSYASYGHVMFIYAIKDNLCYYYESFAYGNYTADDLHVQSVDSFINWYSNCGYVFQGAIYFKPQATQHTVTFKDWNGTTLKTQTVASGGAATAPANPSREGYTFKGWDKSFTSVTSDITVTAQYEINKYTVIFNDYDGTELDRQTVTHGSTAETAVIPKREGYRFTGWSGNLENVTSGMTVTAQYEWGNMNLPVEITTAELSTFSNGYLVSYGYQNHGEENYSIVAVLKNSSGKMVAVESEQITEKNGSGSLVFQYKKGIMCAEIYCVQMKDDKIASPLSKAKSVYTNSDWSDWSTEKPEGSGLIIESRNEYRISTKETTTSANDTLDGWTKYNSEVSYGAWSGNNSTTAKPTEGETLQITGQSTVYNYYHYCSYYDNMWCIDSIWVNSTSQYHACTTNSPLPTYYQQDLGNKQGYGGAGSGAPACAYNFYIWFSNGSTTTYTYQTRDKITTNYFYKWGDFSDWTEGTAPESTDEQTVETRTVYRCKTKSAGEDTDGTERSVSGTLDITDKYGLFYVLDKNGNMEYIGEAPIDENGAYSVEGFITCNELTEQNTDFIGYIAVEGETTPVLTNRFNVDSIDPDKLSADITVWGNYLLVEVTAPKLPQDGVLYLTAYGKDKQLLSIIKTQDGAQEMISSENVEKVKLIALNNITLKPLCENKSYQPKS